MAVLTFSARTAWAKYLLSRPLHLAIGPGDKNWGDVPEPADYEAEALIKEIGRKKLSRGFFVNENDNGEIKMPGGRRYSYSEKPTRQLYLYFDFDYGEGVAELIREIGIFVDTEVKSGLPANQTFFTPENIKSPGILIMLEHLEKLDAATFTPNKRGSYATILTV